MFRGFTTINHFVDDLPRAVAWYSDVLGVEPYFALPNHEEPAYVEFRVGPDQDELGLIDSAHRPAALAAMKPAGAVMHWQVDDVSAAFARLLALGATEIEPATPRGDEGWVTAVVADPWGNVVGLMHSPHFVALHANQG